MKYFQTLPTILQTDFKGNFITVTNLMARAYLVTNLQNNLNVYYDYNVKDFDKPEIIAHKFYDDQYRYWMLFYANGIIDPLAEWPRTDTDFNLYLMDKYKVNDYEVDPITYAKLAIHHYEKTIVTYNNVDNLKSSITVIIDQDTYNSIPDFDSQLFNLPDGSQVTREVSKQIIRLYDYEYQENENKRRIKLLKNNYATDMESQLSRLMSS